MVKEKDYKIGIVEPQDFSNIAIEVLSKIGKVELYDDSKEDIRDFLVDKSAIFVRLKYFITDDLLKEARRLEFICSPTTGLNHIHVGDRYKILSLKEEYKFLSTIRATPEHVFGLCIALLRNYSHAFLTEDRFEWNRDLYKGFELYENTVGIIGMGRIGKILTNYFNAFGAKVYYTDLEKQNIAQATWCSSIKELCEKSYIIILEVDFKAQNRNMIGSSELAWMKGKYFINAARGELVDEKALIAGIKRGDFAGVAVDVLADEVRDKENYKELLSTTTNYNVILTPHIGGATYSSMERTEVFIAKKLTKEREKLLKEGMQVNGGL